MFAKLVIFLSFLSLVFGYKVTVENNGTETINVTYTQYVFYTLEPQKSIDLNVGGETQAFTAYRGVYPDDFVMSMAYVEPSFVTVEYTVLLSRGYNLPITIVPVGQENCEIASCTKNLNDLCPDRYQILDENQKVIACRYDMPLFEVQCPDSTKIFSCSPDTESIRIIFG